MRLVKVLAGVIAVAGLGVGGYVGYGVVTQDDDSAEVSTGDEATDTAGGEAGADTEPTSSSSVEAADEPAATLPATSTTSATTTTEAPIPDWPQVFRLPLPDGEVQAVATNMVDGWRQVRGVTPTFVFLTRLAGGDQQVTTVVADEDGGRVAVTAPTELGALGPATLAHAVFFNGAFHLFAGTANTSPGAATGFPGWRSVDGIDWEQLPATVVGTVPAVIEAVTVVDPAEPTPTLVITGRGPSAVRPEASVWRSVDAETWTATDLPRLGLGGLETGFDVAGAGPLLVVAVGDESGFTTGVVGSTGGGELVGLDVPIEGYITSVQANGEGAEAGVYVGGVDLATADATVQRSSDLDGWDVVDLPGGGSADWSVEASSWHDPVAWVDNPWAENRPDQAELHVLDRGRWAVDELEGWAIVSVGVDHVVTITDHELLVHDRTGP